MTATVEATERLQESVETTIGDLICAIHDAASEARIDEDSLAEVTRLVLFDMLR